MEIFYEQNVVNNHIDERIKRTKTLVVAKTVCWVLGLFILISGAMAITVFWAFLIVSFPFFVIALILSRINKNNNTEYDYVLDDEFLKISEIYFREQRKLKHKVRLRSVESVGVFDSEGYKKATQSPAKKILALVNYDDEQSVVYILYNTDKGKRILFIEPDRGFMITLRRVLPALTVFDKSISDLEKRLNKREEEKQAEYAGINSDDDDNDDTETDGDIASENNADEIIEDNEGGEQ